MKKLSMSITMLMGLFILTGCGNSDGDEEASSQSSVAQSISSSSSSSDETAESTSSTTSSDEQSDTTNSSSLEDQTESNSNSSEETTESTPENIIHSEEEAFNFIKEQTGIAQDSTDIVYGLINSGENYYTLRLVSQSIRDQGGSGTVGIYKVYTDGTYEIGENAINSEEEAFNFIKEQTGIEADNTDIVYEVVESNEDYYVLTLISKSIFDQGGSGTVGLYTIYKDGTYETGQK